MKIEIKWDKTKLVSHLGRLLHEERRREEEKEEEKKKKEKRISGMDVWNSWMYEIVWITMGL